MTKKKTISKSPVETKSVKSQIMDIIAECPATVGFLLNNVHGGTEDTIRRQIRKLKQEGLIEQGSDGRLHPFFDADKALGDYVLKSDCMVPLPVVLDARHENLSLDTPRRINATPVIRNAVAASDLPPPLGDHYSHDPKTDTVTITTEYGELTLPKPVPSDIAQDPRTVSDVIFGAGFAKHLAMAARALRSRSWTWHLTASGEERDANIAAIDAIEAYLRECAVGNG